MNISITCTDTTIGVDLSNCPSSSTATIVSNDGYTSVYITDNNCTESYSVSNTAPDVYYHAEEPLPVAKARPRPVLRTPKPQRRAVPRQITHRIQHHV